MFLYSWIMLLYPSIAASQVFRPFLERGDRQTIERLSFDMISHRSFLLLDSVQM